MIVRVALLVVVAGAAVWAIRWLVEQGDVRSRLAGADAFDVAGAVVALFLVMFTNGIVLRDLVAHFGQDLPMRAWLGITLVSGMMNLVSPVSSAGAVRAVYLKRRYGVAYGSFASLFASSTAFSLALSGALAGLCVVALGIPGGASGYVALATSLALVVGLALAVVLAPVILARVAPLASSSSSGARGRIARGVARMAYGWRTISADHALLTRLVLWNAGAAILYGAAAVLAFRIAGFQGSTWVPLATSAFARIGALIAITPAGLGITEAFGVVSARVVGADAAAALLGLLVMRAMSTALSIGGGAIAFLFISRESEPPPSSPTPSS
jgi:hypothetical protein